MPVCELNESGAEAWIDVEERRPKEEVEMSEYPLPVFPTKMWPEDGSVEIPVPP